ncbi:MULTISPECIES: hypothetical protein [Pseudomonas]|jgi:Cu/Ag efflux pump CusA|uniref:DUF4342 domain-containing protein n=1 Tax=Pseudomonas monachiensis TaxID=3060212 RepID=A0ABW9HFE0_9PSED|nr:hypothetical protein [Pseudomonas sp. BF-RE-26]
MISQLIGAQQLLDPLVQSRHSISAFIKALTSQGKVIDLHATDRVIVIIIIFGLVLGLAAIAIVIAIALPLLIIAVFQAVSDITCTARIIAIGTGKGD